MTNLKNIKNQKFYNSKLIEILFFTFPLSFIIGNLIISIHLLLFIAFSLLLIKKSQLPFRFNKSNYLLIIFFLYLFLTTVIQIPKIIDIFFEIRNIKVREIPLEINPIFKSFLLLRFIILVIVVDTLVFNKILDLRKFFYFSLLCTSFVSLDIILQYITGYDIFGFKSISESRSAGPFGDEAIAGTYLQKFSFFSFFCIYFINFKNKNFNKLLLFFVIVLHSSAILLSGNRMPMILFIFGCLIIIAFVKNFRFVMSLSLVVFTTISIYVNANNPSIYNRTIAFINEINFIKNIQIKKNITTNQNEKNEKSKKVKQESKFSISFIDTYAHNSIYKTSLEVWKIQPLFGNGLKSFRFACWTVLSKTKGSRLSCSNHSHNYYLEILTDAGIIGSFFIIIFFIIMLKDSFRYIKWSYRKANSDLYLFIPIFITFFLEIWPLKSTGSFFTTGNATFLWLIVSLISGIIYKKNYAISSKVK